ncbi:MAG: 3-phosphoshikimate 1-carboxyvinyltransferase, partial [Dehalococcoidales bacterium]|nr:3-phosphoshikimate 1-carboxyvinyltransferase [Dehalococcoidales bacterium]
MKGRATAPSSKSYTIRALLAGALADGNSYVSNPLYSDDTWAAIEILRNLGATTTIGESGISIKGGSLHATPATLDCRDSAATLRFISAICATLPGVSA